MTVEAETESWGTFELLSPLGKGGMAEVWEARYLSGPRVGERVALKRVRAERTYDAEARELLRQEAAVVQALEHPGVVHFVESGELRGVSYFAMELVEGTDLGRMLTECRRRRIALPVDVTVFMLQQVLEALAYVHMATGRDERPLGLVHCDVTPSNVLVSRTGEVKLADFGVARTRGGTRVDTRRLGKPHYRSPELLTGEVSAGVDVWAAGIMLYELLTLETPFSGGTAEQLEAAIREGRATPVRERLPELSERLVRVVDKALAPNPVQRFSTAAQFARALASLYDERVATPLAIAAVVRGLAGTG